MRWLLSMTEEEFFFCFSLLPSHFHFVLYGGRSIDMILESLLSRTTSWFISISIPQEVLSLTLALGDNLYLGGGMIVYSDTAHLMIVSKKFWGFANSSSCTAYFGCMLCSCALIRYFSPMRRGRT